MADYPKRGSHFAHKFVRIVHKSCACQLIGRDAVLLCIFIAHTEDAARYSGPVRFWNSQLSETMGFRSPKQLQKARAKAVEAGWLVYLERGTRAVGEYFVDIPQQYSAVTSSPMVDDFDESILSADGTNSGTNSGTQSGTPNGLEAERIADRKRNELRNTSYPYPKLHPSPAPRSAAARHAATVEDCSDIRRIDLTPLAREVEPADIGGMANGSVAGHIKPECIVDPSLMVNWFRQQLSHDEPVTGSTGLDLFLVLAKTLEIKRRSNKLKNPAGVLVQALRSGEWLSNRECLREARKLMDEAEARGELKWQLNGTEVSHV